jgi:sugar phosphate isomerase/epimerase
MRVAVITDEISQDLDEALAVCARHGVRAIEIRSVWDTPPHELDDEQCREIARRAREGGFTIAAFGSSVFKTPPPRDEDGLAAATRSLERAVVQAGLLGTDLVRVFTFYRDGAPDPVGAARIMAAVLERVSLGGVRVAVETGTRTNTPTVAGVRTLLAELRHPALGVLWDPGNTVFAGFDDGDGLVGLDEIADGDLLHVHVKDPDGRRGYVELGRGDVDWPQILAELRRRGYPGHVSLETHWRVGRVLSARERDEPWSRAFSAGGVEASDRCLGVLTGWTAA